MSSEEEYRVLDLFYLKGSQALLRIAITIFSMMEESVLAADNFEEILMILGTFATDHKNITTKKLLTRFAGPIS